MKILRVIASMNPSSGGPCQGVRNSIPELERLGVHNEVVSLDDPDADHTVDDIFPVHALGNGKNPWRYSSKLVPWLMEHLHRFDVVIIHGLWLYHSHAVRKAMQLLRDHPTTVPHKLPKVFVMPHGMLDPYFQKATGRKLKAIRNWIYWKLIESKVVNEADGLLFTCAEELQLARQPFYPYLPRRELNVGYGIAPPPPFVPGMTEAFKSKCSALNQPYLLFLSRIHEKKGVDLLIKAYADIACQILETKNEYLSTVGEPQASATKPGEFPVLVVAGPGLETAYGQKIQKLVSESHALQGKVFFPGMLTGDAKWGAFYGCDAFILPSHQENFGIAVVEALACGKPVLISDQVNIWKEIEGGGSGIVAGDTGKGTRKLIERWCQLSGEEKQAMGQQAQEVYRKHFAIESIAKNLLLALS